MTLERYLKEKNYTEAEIEETLIRLEEDMPIPKEVWEDLNEFYNEERL